MSACTYSEIDWLIEIRGSNMGNQFASNIKLYLSRSPPPPSHKHHVLYFNSNNNNDHWQPKNVKSSKTRCDQNRMDIKPL